MATTAQDYYTIQSSAALTFTLIHELMGRIPVASPEWDELRALGQLATQISGAAYDAARGIDSQPVPYIVNDKCACARQGGHCVVHGVVTSGAIAEDVWP